MVKLCLECDKISTLLQVLDFTPPSFQKTLVFTSSKEEADMVSKVFFPEKCGFPGKACTLTEMLWEESLSQAS